MGTRQNFSFPDNPRFGGHPGERAHHDHRPDFSGAERFAAGAERFGRGAERFGRAMGRGRGPGFGGGFGPGAAGFGGFGGPGFGGFGPGFGPRGGRGRARKGDVRLAILSLLNEAPANGYGLMKAIAERTDGSWKPSPGSVYPTLAQLVDEDLIVESGEGRQSTFDLTEAGRAYVAEHSDEIATAWGDATVEPGRHDEFIVSAMKLAGVLKQFHFDATAEQRSEATAKIDELRRALYTILAD